MERQAADGYFGNTIRRRVCGDFRVIEKRHVASQAIPEHQHLEAYATFVIDGEYVERIGGRDSVIPRGSVLLHPGGESHSNRFAGRDATLLNVEIPERVAGRSAVDRNQPIVDPEIQTIGIRIRRELYHGDDLSPIIIEGIVLELFGLVHRRSAQYHFAASSIAARADALITARFAEPIGLGLLAEELNVDPARLSRSFRKEIGCTVGERIRQRRIQCAREIIRDGVSLSEAALATGFADQSHLTRTFRAVVGLTPGEYRRRLS